MKATQLADEMVKQEEAINTYLKGTEEEKMDSVVRALISLGVDNNNLVDKIKEGVLSTWLPVLDKSLEIAMQASDTEILSSFMLFDSAIEVNTNVEVKASRIPFIVENVDLAERGQVYITSPETTVLNLRCKGDLNVNKLVITENVVFVICQNVGDSYSGKYLDLEINSKYLQAYDIYSILQNLNIDNLDYKAGDLTVLQASSLLSSYKTGTGERESLDNLMKRNGVAWIKGNNPEVVTDTQGETIELTEDTCRVTMKTDTIKKNIAVYQTLDNAFIGKKIEQVVISLEGEPRDTPNGVFNNCTISRVIVDSNISTPIFVDCEIKELLFTGEVLRLSNAFTRCTFGNIQGEHRISFLGKGAFLDCSFRQTEQMLDKLKLAWIKELEDKAFEGSTDLLSLSGRLRYSKATKS